MFPWLVPLQIIKDFSSIHTINANDKPVWITALDIDDSEKFKLFAGDSDGSMLTFQVPPGQEFSQVLELENKKSSIHRIGVIQTHLV